MTDEIKLLPCPFCGGRATIREEGYLSAAYWVGCDTDGCLGCDHWEVSYAEAIAAWNTRALATSIPTVQETGIDIAAIENGGRRWHGEDHRIVSVRWEPYKPDGQRQMKAKGRWQEQVGSGDYWRWQNCDRPAALAASQPADPVTNASCCQPVKVKPLVWEHGRNRLQMDSTMMMGKGYDFDTMELTRQEGYGFGCGYIIWAIYTGLGKRSWNIYGTLDGIFIQDIASEDAAKAAAQADYEARILSALEDAPRVSETPKSEHDRVDVLTAGPAPVAPSLRITGPNSDGEYWLHIKAGGRSGGVNLGGERGPICKQLLDAASETGAKE